MSLSVIIPTCSEASNLPIFFQKIEKALSSAYIAFEMIVAGDLRADRGGNMQGNPLERNQGDNTLKNGTLFFVLLPGF